MSDRRRIVLYSPVQADPAGGIPYSKDILPLSLLTIAAGPALDGFEVVLIDGEVLGPEEGHRRVLEACDGALLYATTGILGYQVTDGFLCSSAVRGRYPKLPSFIGGWFASTAPELQLATGLYDAVALGQGEQLFRELVAAVHAGEPLESVAGLVLPRDGEHVRTAPRGAIGWERIPPVPWHLFDFEPYRRAQLSQRAGREWEAVPPPPWPSGERPYVAFSYFSSYGCPLQCTFCCSPEVSGLRWKAMGAQRMVEDVLALRERFGFDVVRWLDANYGVMERRVREVAEGFLAAGRPVHQLGYMQAPSVCRYEDATLDAMADSGFYHTLLGGETGDEDTMRIIKKTTRAGENLRAAQRLTARGIDTQLTYILGFPGESRESMLATLEEVRRIQVACPRSVPQVWPFRPIPGTPLFRQALEMGYPPPRTLPEWGAIGDYRHHATWRDNIPPDIVRRRKLFNHYSTLAKGVVRGKVGWWERRALRRLERDDWRFGRLEAKAFDVSFRLRSALAGAGSA